MFLGKQLENSIGVISELAARIPRQIDMLKKELDLCHEETIDLLHQIEMTNFNASEGYRISKDLQITRKKRRELKDELELLEKLDSRMNKHSKLTVAVEAMTRDIGAQKSKLSTRKYHLRVRKDLTPHFDRVYNNRGVN